MHEAPSEKLKILHFILQDVRLCMELQYIERVLPLPLLEAVPGSPIYFAGLMNYQGESVPIIDLALRLGLTRGLPYSLDTPILLCFEHANRVGLIIDKIVGLADIEKRLIQMHDAFVSTHSPFSGAVALETGVSLLVDVPQILKVSLIDEKSEFSLDHDLINSAKNNHG